MAPSEQNDKEVEFCHFMEYIFSEEPYHTEFKVTSAATSFFIYHNEQSCNVFDDMLIEFDHKLDLHGLVDRGWREFSARRVSPSGAIAQSYGFGLLFEFIKQNWIDLFVSCDNLETYLHV